MTPADDIGVVQAKLDAARADVKRLREALDRCRREGGFSPHHCPGCDAGTDETFYDEPAEHWQGCWLAEALAATAPPRGSAA